MNIAHPEALKPRKTPRQARSEATVDAIFEATIQVLLSEGAQRLTTTRVAERAGVSVGTMYQYFPHKQSLLYAVLQKHLEAVAEAVEAACREYRGQALDAMIDGVVDAFIDAKTADGEGSRALYSVAASLDTAELIDGITKRTRKALTMLLASASDATFDDLPAITFTMQAAMAGTSRAVFERGAKPSMLRILRSQLSMMCRGYLRLAAK